MASTDAPRTRAQVRAAVAAIDAAAVEAPVADADSKDEKVPAPAPVSDWERATSPPPRPKWTPRERLDAMLPEALFAAHRDQCTRAFVRHMKQIGTVHNQRVYVAVSRRTGEAMLGLFAGVAIPRGKVVTEYGGQLYPADEVAVRTHSRRVPGTDYVRDGFHQSLLFTVPFAHPHGPTPAFATRRAVHRTCGVGYMSNTGPRDVLNVRVVNVSTLRNGVAPVAMFLVATRDIAAGDEILTAYNNNESRALAAAEA